MKPAILAKEKPASFIRRIFQWVERVYDKEIDGTGLAIFRIIFCTVQLAEVLHLFYFRHLIFDVIPFVEPYVIDLTVPLLLWAATLVLMILGLFTRVATVINYIFLLVFMGTIKAYEYHMFYVYEGLGVMFLFMPIARCLSLDRLLLKLKYSNTRFRYVPSRTVSQLAYLVPVVAGIAFVYFDSCLHKLTSPLWMAGLGTWLPASMPFITHANSGWLLNQEWLVRGLGYLTFAFEFLFIFLCMRRRFRLPLMLIGVGLHVGILLAFPIPLFGIGFGSLYLLMVPVGFWRRLWASKPAGQEKLTFYYDAECPLCARTRVVMEHFDTRQAVTFRSVQSHAALAPGLAGIAEETLLGDVHSVDRQGRVYRGIDTYVQVLSAIWYLKPLSWLLRVPGIYHLGKAVYSFIARRRTTERCTEDNCGYVPPALPHSDKDFKLLEGVTMHHFKVAALGIGLLLLLGVQVLTSYDAPLIRILRNNTGFESTGAGHVAAKVSAASTSFSKVFAGIRTHGVFMDHHFHNYRRLVAVTYTDAQGIETFLPMTRESGHPGPYVYGAMWVNWTFRVVSGNPNQAALEKGIRDYTAFWATKHGLSLNHCQFKVKVKSIQPHKTTWERDFLNRQLAQPWQDAGTVQWKNQQFTAALRPITSF